MKKVLAIVLTAVMIFALCACGNIKDVTKMAYIGDEAVTKGQFNYYLMMSKYEASQAASQNGDTLSTEEDWKTVMIDDVTAYDYAIDKAKDYAKQSLVLKQKAIEEGMTLEQEDLDSIKEQRTSFIEQAGGTYNYEQYFSANGFTLEDIESILTNDAYSQKVVTKYFGDGTEDGEITVSEEDVKAAYEKDYVMAKHILLMNDVKEDAEETVEDPELEEGAPEEEAEMTDEEKEAAQKEADEAAAAADEAASALAKELIEKLDGGADFDALMRQYTEDVDAETGEINGGDGYLFTTEQMMPEFEEAAFALEVDKYSAEPVKTDYGYHVLLRLPLPTQGEDYEGAISAIKSTLLNDLIEEYVDTWAQELGLVFNDKAITRVKMM